MRKETDKIVTAFIEGRPAHSQRTMTDGVAIYLHGNRIAWKHDGKIYASMCGWPTATTRDRLNGLCRKMGFHGFSQMGFKQYYYDREIKSTDVIELTKG